MTSMHPSHDLYPNIPLIVRRVVNKFAHPFGINPFPRCFHYALKTPSTAQAFDHIYEQNLWGSEESRSGVGSTLIHTQRYRLALVALLKEREIRTMFDAPCGDMRWMPYVLREVSLNYHGGDVSPALITALRSTYPDLTFTPFDITRDAFPISDVWHCRDCLFHLPLADVKRALENFVRSEIPYALLTTHRARLMHQNLDLPGIGFRLLDLERAPFHLPPALAYLPDFRIGRDFPRYVGLWSREAIAKALSAKEHTNA
jgi:hypothetical protein